MRELAAGLWTVDAELAGLPIGRRMIVARRAAGDVLVHSAVCADAATMTTIEALGPLTAIIIPSRHHLMDAAAWKHRYPTARVLARPAAVGATAKRVAVDGDLAELGPDPAVTWTPLAGAPEEGVLLHQAADGLTVVFNDAFMNLPDRLPGVRGAVMKLIGSTGGPKVTRIARWFIVKDHAAHAAQLRELAARPDLRRVVPGHGAIIDGADAARAALRRAADGLGAG